MAEGLTGKIALVTGGGSGIGRATALTFAREGATVVIADINAEGAAETVRLVQDRSGQASSIKADVTKPSDVEKMVDNVIESHGRLDCAYNNAGIGGTQIKTHEYPEDDWDNVIDVNLKGVWLCMRYEIPHMLKQGSGTIVNTSSILGVVGCSNMAAYNASKHGVAGLTKTAAIEYARSGIRVNAVAPAVINTPMVQQDRSLGFASEVDDLSRTPLGRIGEPQEVAEAVVWLCSDAASFVTGHIVAVDGGYLAM